MSQVRRYVMPGSAAEKRALVEEIARAYADFFGTPVRQALVAQWWQMSLPELHHVAGKWRALMRRLAERGVALPAVAPPAPVVNRESRREREARWSSLFQNTRAGR